jgi:platelet-activating factor acetylhydrolase IB subunit beta/gamma
MNLLLLPIVVGFAALTACHAAADPCPRPSTPYASMSAQPREGAKTRQARQGEAGQARARSGSFDTIVLGDSIMARWPQGMLEQAVGSQSVLNAGVGGDRTENTLWRLRNGDWGRQAPRRVLILVGTNNTGDDDACEVAWGVRSVAAEARRRFPTARIAVISLLPRGERMAERADLIGAVNDNLRRGAVGGEYGFIDAHDAFNCNRKTPCALMDRRRHLHPTRSGYEVLGRIVTREFK